MRAISSASRFRSANTRSSSERLRSAASRAAASPTRVERRRETSASRSRSKAASSAVLRAARTSGVEGSSARERALSAAASLPLLDQLAKLDARFLGQTIGFTELPQRHVRDAFPIAEEDP
jgi:hypothetical protein